MGDSQPSGREFRVLGPIEVLLDGRRVDLGGPKPRALLAALVANRGQVVSAESLIDALWGESPPATARKSLQKFVWALRKDLGETLVTRDPGYAIELADLELDAARLETAVANARSSTVGWERALEGALSSWRGSPFPELADTAWGPAETTGLTELRLEAEEMLIERQLSNQGYQGAIARLEELVSRYPYRERLWALLMTALYGSGRQADALAAYQRLRTTLGDELGIEPSKELADLEESILLHEPDLIPAGTTSPPNNLPAPVTSFIGRESEIEEVTAMLSEGRLVTLLGTAGSGKTRLAIELGRSLLGEFVEDGVWFVDLAPVAMPDQVIHAIADVLGVGKFAELPAQEVMATYLADRRLVLIFDNCEHLVGRVAELTQVLLRAAQALVIVVTSRERLGVDGEMIFDLPPLPYPSESEAVSEEFDAVRLFLERARSVTRGDELTRSFDEIGEIVRRLDGLPLALELAAARVRTFGPAELRDRLDDRFSLLTSPSRGPVQRHHTLEAALDWSYRLLDALEQTLFVRLSVFSGGFDLDSATEVCGMEPLDKTRVVGLIAELVDKSLISMISRDGGRRYLLLESLRQYGDAQLDSPDRSRLRRAHMLYFRDLAERAADHLHGPEQGTWLATLHLEYDNLRKALRWAFDTSPLDGVRLAVALGGYWDSMGPRTDGNDWLGRAVDASEDLELALHIDALFEAASIASSVEASIPVGYATRALEHAVEAGDEIREGRALRALSWALAVDEQPKAALEAGMKALEIFERHEDKWEVALCLERLGQSSYQDPEWSVEMLERALSIYREVGDRSREALALHKAADRLAHSLGDLDKAVAYARRSVEICDEIGSTHDGGHARLEYGKILRRAGKLDDAVAELRAALGETTKSGDERCSIRSLTALGNTLLEAGNTEEAAPTLHEALIRSRNLGEIHTTRSALAGLARMCADTGRPGEATVLLGFVEQLSRNLDVPVSDRALEKREAERAGLASLLGDDFDVMWERGRSMSIEEATDLALTTAAG